jgi:hypothetical protein
MLVCKVDNKGLSDEEAAKENLLGIDQGCTLQAFIDFDKYNHDLDRK